MSSSFGSKLVDHGGHVDRVPGHNCVGHQVQAARLIHQLPLLLLRVPPRLLQKYALSPPIRTTARMQSWHQEQAWDLEVLHIK